MRDMPSESIDMIFTDPPYGHNNNNGDLIHNVELALGRTTIRKEARPIMNDGVEATELFQKVVAEASRILKKHGACCCCCCGGGGGPDPQFARWSLILDNAMTFKQMVVWDKGPMGMGWHYRRSYETILIAHRGKKCRWYDDSHRIENIIRDIPKIIPTKAQHPTQKPVDLAAHFIKLHSREGDIIFDPVMGSGSTGIAAVRLNRNFIGIEIDEHWYNVAKERITADLPLFSEVVK